MKNKYFFKSVIALVILFFSTSLTQEKKIASETSEIKEIEYNAISVIEIPQKIDEVYTFLKRINSVEIPAIEQLKLEDSFNTLLTEIEPLKKESTTKIIENTTNKKLKDYTIKWEQYLTTVGKLKATLHEVSQQIDTEREKIKQLLAYWEVTNTKAKKEKAPKHILKRLLELKKQVKKTDKALFAILSDILSLRDKISVEEVKVKETVALINIQLEKNRSLLFTLDSQPIWTAIYDTSDSTTFADNFNSSSARIFSAIKDFWDMYSEEFPYYIGFFFLIYLVVLYLKRFADHNFNKRERVENKYSMRILQKPFSISFLITIYFELAFFPLAPSVIAELTRILIVLPILFLFPTFISKTSRAPLYFITSIYLFQQIVDLSIATSSIHLRIVVILLTLLMIVALYWFLKINIKNLDIKRIKLLSALRIISRLLLVILTISLIGNVIGNTALSTLIFSGVMRTIYTSLIIITSLQVFNTLLTILLETGAARISLIVKNESKLFKKTIFGIVKFVAIIFWSITFLINFEIYESISNFVILLFTTPLEAGSFSITMGDISLFFFSIWLSTKFSKIIRFFFETEIFPRVRLPRGVPAAVSLIMNYTILSLGFLFALTVVGFNVEKFAIVAGALGVGIGFGLQNIVNNFISGLILLFERPIQVGDTISLTNNLLGTVRRIGIRASIIQTYDGSEVMVPNADLISGQVTNWTLSDSRRRIEIKIGVHFNTDPNKVIDILTKALEGEKDILEYPSSYVLFKGHHDSTQNFDLRFWTANNDDWIFIRSNILLKVTKMLNDAGIEIPYQQQNIYLTEMNKKSE